MHVFRPSRLPLPFALAAATGLFALLAPSAARADDPKPAYAPAPVEGPQYVAPLAQTTQPSYVPQSVAMSGPSEIGSWSEGDPIPAGYRPVERMRKGLVIGGAVTLGSLYLISALTASVAGDVNQGSGNPDAALYVPVFGPFVQMAKEDSSTAKLFLAVDGLAQGAGAAMLIIGLTCPRTVLVRNDLAEIRVVPMVGKGTTGAGIFGTF